MEGASRAILSAVALLAASALIAPVPAAEPPWRVCFTPGEDCSGLIVSEIAQAHSEILVQAYSFTSVPILSALKAAHERGLDVKVIVDKTSARVSKSGSRYSAATYLANAGIPVWVDTHVSIAHNKVMVIDSATVITGSFNFTAAAQYHNAENLLVIRDRKLAAEYRGNWQRREAMSIPYGGPIEGGSSAEE
jgi:phosphatidylserine/phosphatidylglycerophosphate/cardiolipin synthase-like enzyme